MTREQQAAYYAGYDDRSAHRPMRDTFSIAPVLSNAYANGYRDACCDADTSLTGRGGREGWHE